MSGMHHLPELCGWTRRCVYGAPHSPAIVNRMRGQPLMSLLLGHASGSGDQAIVLCVSNQDWYQRVT